jgi:L-seryl-tRNA(Ser) seleniumtransferase
LHEVGTTNRTRAEDYRNAANAETGLLLKVHTSNFRVVGFTEEVSMTELAELGRELDVPSIFDLGSGLLEHDDLQPLPEMGNETLVQEAVASGIDIVSFSGDKLFGGPQAGLIVGKRKFIEELRKNPIYRAMRLDKATLAGLEGTVRLILDGRGDEIPARAMMCRPLDELKSLAEALAARLDAIPGLHAEVIADKSQPGSGSAPDVFLDTWAVRLLADTLSPDALARRLRMGDPSLFARIQDNGVVCDPRTLLDGEADGMIQAFEQALEATAG